MPTSKKGLQSLHYASSLHLHVHKSSAITPTKMKLKERFISPSLNIINIKCIHMLILIQNNQGPFTKHEFYGEKLYNNIKGGVTVLIICISSET